jgi:hypothetical protein
MLIQMDTAGNKWQLSINTPNLQFLRGPMEQFVPFALFTLETT